MQCTSYHNFLHKKIPYLHALQGNREMAARYLDPKYSRWISVDPALGEYVPGAGKANAKDSANLPGMGGLFNAANLNLFHYAGNNPVKYVDPDGRVDYIYTLDEDGNKTVTKENEWKILEFLHPDRYFVEMPDGTRYRANSYETVSLYTGWNKIDTKFLNGKFKEMIEKANEKTTNLYRILTESVGEGKELDFKWQMDKDTLYFNGMVLYNRNEAGNFVWAYFLESHDYHFIHSILAQGGSILISHRLDEWHDTKARWTGVIFYNVKQSMEEKNEKAIFFEYFFYKHYYKCFLQMCSNISEE